MAKQFTKRYSISYTIHHGIFELDKHKSSSSKLIEIIECSSDAQAIRTASQRADVLAKSYAPNPKTKTVRVIVKSITEGERNIPSEIHSSYDPRRDTYHRSS